MKSIIRLKREKQHKLHHEQKYKNLIWGYFYNFLAVILFFLVNLFSKWQYLYIPDLQLNVIQIYRGITMVLISVIYMIIKKDNSLTTTTIKQKGGLLLNGLVADFIYIFYTYSCLYLRLGTAYSILYTFPFITAFLAFLLLRENIVKLDIIALLVGFLSICLITKFGLKEEPFVGVVNTPWVTLIGIILSFMGSIWISLKNVLTKYLKFSYSTILICFYIGLAACIASPIRVWAFGEYYTINRYYIIFGCLSGLATFYANYYMISAYKYISLTETMPLNFATILLSFISGTVLMQNSIDVLDIIGCLLLIIFNIYYVKAKIKH